MRKGNIDPIADAAKAVEDCVDCRGKGAQIATSWNRVNDSVLYDTKRCDCLENLLNTIKLIGAPR